MAFRVLVIAPTEALATALIAEADATSTLWGVAFTAPTADAIANEPTYVLVAVGDAQRNLLEQTFPGSPWTTLISSGDPSYFGAYLPAGDTTVSSLGVNTEAPGPDGWLQTATNDATGPMAMFYAASALDGPMVVQARSRGTIAAPLAVQDGDQLGGWVGAGWAQNGAAEPDGPSAGWMAIADAPVVPVPPALPYVPGSLEAWLTDAAGAWSPHVRIEAPGRIVAQTTIGGGGFAGVHINGSWQAPGPGVVGDQLAYFAGSGADSVGEFGPSAFLAVFADVGIAPGIRPANFQFWTQNAAGVTAERARITAAGSLLVGATAPMGSERLRIAGGSLLEGPLIIQEQGASTLLALGAVADGQMLVRSGTALVGQAQSGAADPLRWTGPRSFFGARAHGRNGGAASVHVVGMSAVATYGTLAPANTSTGMWTRFTTALGVGNKAGLNTYASAVLRPDLNADFWCRIQPTVATNIRFWMSLAAGVVDNFDSPQFAGVGFRFSTVAGDAGIVGYASDGALVTYTPSLATWTADVPRLLRVRTTDGGASWRVSVDGGAEAVITTALPAATLELGPTVLLVGQEAGVSKDIRFGSYWCEHNG